MTTNEETIAELKRQIWALDATVHNLQLQLKAVGAGGVQKMTVPTQAAPANGWLQDGSLVYRLEQTPYGLSNCDEIDVKQVGSSRDINARAARAAEIIAIMNSAPQQDKGCWVSDEEVEQLARLVRDLDVALNGLGAAKQASLCDVVSQVTLAAQKLGRPVLAPQQAAPAEVLGWINEDELPESYPYSDMYPYSKVDTVRMFPVFGPQAAPQQVAPAEQFDADGFRAWVLRNLPDDTIISNGAWWANHLTVWAQRFVNAAPQQEVQESADLPDVEDMAHSAVQEALSFGVNHDVFYRHMRAVMDKTVAAMKAQPATSIGAESVAADLLTALQSLVAEYEPNLKAFAYNAPRKAKWVAAIAAIDAAMAAQKGGA